MYMAFADIAEKYCLCVFLQQAGDPAKQQLRTFLEASKALIAATKAVWILLNTDIEDQAKKAGLEALLEVYQASTQPLRVPARYLENYARAYADCAPVAFLGQAVKKFTDELLGDVDDLEFQIEQYIASIAKNQAKVELFDRLIGILDDVIDAIDLCGSV